MERLSHEDQVLLAKVHRDIEASVERQLWIHFSELEKRLKRQIGLYEPVEKDEYERWLTFLDFVNVNYIDPCFQQFSSQP